MTTWTTWRPPGAPFPFAAAMYNDEWFMITEAGHDPETGELAASATEQARIALGKITVRLEEAGFALSDIIMIRPYVAAREFAPEFDAVFAEGLPDPKPLTGALIVGELFDPAMKIEVEIIAQKGAELR